MTILRQFSKRFLRDPRLGVAAIYLVVVAVAAILGPVVAPHDPNAQSLLLRLKPPAWMEGGDLRYLLGTDQLGRDLLSRVIVGARISLLVGLATVVVGTLIGGTVGILAGYFGKGFDAVIMRLADIQLSFPYILLTLAVVAVLGPGVTTVIGVLGVASWPAYARIARGATLSIRQRDFISAAVALGNASPGILTRHVTPNIAGSIVVLATLQVSQMMMSEAALSFLGAGVPITTPTWGGMLNEGQQYIFGAWWLTIFPGLALTSVVIAFNFLGDGLGDLLG